MYIMGKIKITKEEIKELYENNISTLKIAKIAECNTSNITSHLNRMGVKMKKNGSYRTYKINENYFDNIDTEYKAYILGFLYADGYNQESKNQIRITLNKKDRDILEKIKKELNYTKPLKLMREDYLDLSINSERISQQLALKGCPQKKSLILTFPDEDILLKDFYKDFIRGYFDGDGCFSVRDRKDRPSKCYQFTMIGTLSFLTKVQEILIDNIGLNKIKIYQYGNIYSLHYVGRTNFTKFSEYIYSNCNIYLNRKYNKYISTLS